MAARPDFASTPLAAAEIVILDGLDAVAFAHAQFTNNVATLDRDCWQWNAWLDAQGRVRHFFALLKVGEQRLLAWQPLGSASMLREALARYVFRAKVTLDAPQGWSQGRVDSSPPFAAAIAPDHVSSFDERIVFAQPGSRQRLVCLQRDAGVRFDETAAAQWRHADIEARLPLIAEQASAMFVPQSLEFDRIGAIRFDKGCYPGQEIAARLHFRGGNKRALRRVEIDAASAMPGAALTQLEGDAIGHVLYASPRSDGRFDALAVVSTRPNAPTAA